ncbi:hypothetical protein TAMYLO_180038 [Tenacibaculum amylolyticum]
MIMIFCCLFLNLALKLYFCSAKINVNKNYIAFDIERIKKVCNEVNSKVCYYHYADKSYT